MKTNCLLLIAIVLSLTAQAQDVLRLTTYNIKNGVGMDEVSNLQRTADVISRIGPDVVAIQETDSMTQRSGRQYVLGELARRTHMHAYFAPAIPFDGGKYGIGLLCKEAPLRLQSIPLPGREEERTLLLAEFAGYIYCCTHLSLTEEDRMRSLPLIKNLASGTTKPFFLAGDMNAEPGSDFIKALSEDFRVLSNQQLPTYPADRPQETLDYIVVLKTPQTDKINVLSTQVIEESMASDHRPVVVDLHFKGQE